MIGDNISTLLNKQINEELYSAYLYLDFAKFYDCRNLKGFAAWYKIQAEEESNARDIISLIERTEGSGAALYLADVQMSKRKKGN